MNVSKRQIIYQTKSRTVFKRISRKVGMCRIVIYRIPDSSKFIYNMQLENEMGILLSV